ncbi:MAG: T9SS type A sorting domain-containing protein [Flavobacteriales bacterium]|nr:T9SS type A sorting domain-containing protein [Flavobacteriales bacterium]
MKKLLCIALLFLSSNVWAQNWCAPGAEWTYTLRDNGVGGYTRFTYIGDTLMDGAIAQKLHKHLVEYNYILGEIVESDLPMDFTTVEDDLVSIWNGQYFDTLYWFGAAPGDRWSFSMDPVLWPDTAPTPHYIDVMDTGSTIVDGIVLRYLQVYNSNLWSAPGSLDVIFERIGSVYEFLVPNNAIWVDGIAGPLRCYSDDQINFQSPNWNGSCDYVTGIWDKEPRSNVTIFPHPCTDRLTLSGITPGSQIELFDGLGRNVFTGQALGEPFHFDASTLAPGLYQVRIRNGEQVISWIKE